MCLPKQGCLKKNEKLKKKTRKKNILFPSASQCSNDLLASPPSIHYIPSKNVAFLKINPTNMEQPILVLAHW